MAATKRTKKQREQNLAELAELYLPPHSWTQNALAEYFGVGQSQISQDLKAIATMWRDSAIRDFDLARAVELEKINALETVHAEAWEASRVSYNVVDNETGVVDKVQLGGDPRHLTGIQWCISERCKLLELYPTNKLSLTDPSGTKEYVGGGLSALLTQCDQEYASDSDKS